MRKLFLIGLLVLCRTQFCSSQVVPGQANIKTDKYRAALGYPCAGGSGATGFFYLYKDTSLRHWLWCDPEGYRFFLQGVQVVDYGSGPYIGIIGTKYGAFGSATGWEALTTRRLQDMGFTGVGEYSRRYLFQPDNQNPNPIPFIATISPALYNSAGTKDPYANLPPKWDTFGGYRGFGSIDLYDPVWQGKTTGAGGNLMDCVALAFAITCAAMDASPYLLAVGEDDVSRVTELYANQGVYSIGISAPYEQFENSFKYVRSQVFSTPIMYAKQTWANWLCATRYASLAALNVAWGSTYSTCGSSATTAAPETIGTGDGVTTSFAHTFSHLPVDPASVGISVGGVLQGGDTPWFNVNVCTKTSGNGCVQAATGNINGSNIAYATGVITVTFSAAPANGVAITATYQYSGWPKATSGGTGVMDEDGTSAWWPAGDPESRVDFPDIPVGTIQTDMDVFLGIYAIQYLKPVHDWLKSNLPHHMVGSVNPGGLGFRTSVYNSMALYSDVLIEANNLIYDNSQVFGTAGPNAIAVGQYNSSPVPIYIGVYSAAVKDSKFAASSCQLNVSLCFLAQNSKGGFYQSQAASAWSIAGADGYGFVVGTDYWQYTDNQSENGAYGLVSLNDNMYDGNESLTTSIVDPYGLKTTAEVAIAQTGYAVATGDGVASNYVAPIKLLPITPGTFSVVQTTTAQTQSGNFSGTANPIGAPWTTITGMSDLKLVSGVVQGTATNADNGAYNTSQVWPSGQYSECTVGLNSDVGSFGYCMVYVAAGANTHYRVQNSDTRVLTLIKKVAGSDTSLASFTGTITTGDVLRIEVTQVAGNAALVVKQTTGSITTTRITYTDSSSPLSSGSPGMGLKPNGNLTLTTMTNWHGGTITTVTGTDDGVGNVTGTGITSGTLQYVNPGTLNITYSSPVTLGSPITAAFTQNGFGGYQPSFVPSVRTQNALTQRNLVSGTYSILSTNLGLEKPAMFTSATEVLQARSFGDANDGDTTTSWQPSATNPQTYRIDLVGLPSISKIILRWGAVYATAYTLDWSDDGLSWTTAFTQAAGAGGVETDTFTAVSHRYWRGNFTARSGAGSLQLQEIEPYAQ